MKFLNGTSSLSSIIGGRLNAGDVPLDRILRGYHTFTTTGIVTVLAASTNIIALNSVVPVIVGDYVLAFVSVSGSKGVTLGSTTLSLILSGASGVVNWFTGGSLLQSQQPDQPASSTLVALMAGFGVVSASDTLDLQLTGVSAGSNLTIATGAADVGVVVLRNS